mgnify:CR=1 FL=1
MVAKTKHITNLRCCRKPVCSFRGTSRNGQLEATENAIVELVGFALAPNPILELLQLHALFVRKGPPVQLFTPSTPTGTVFEVEVIIAA